MLSHERTSSTGGLADKLVFHVVANVHLKMLLYNTYVYERVKKLTLVNVIKERKLGITALAKS